MINCIIIDDEKKCIQTLEIQLRKHCPELTVVATCDNAEQGIISIAEHKPELVFLDIEMPRMNGFDMLERIGDIQFHVVFTTAYNQFAIKAFQFSALNYLLKPIDPDDLKETMRRVQNNRKDPIQAQLEVLMQSMRTPAPKTQRIALSSSDGMTFVNIDEIMYCQSENNYTYVFLVGGEKHLLARTLKDFEETLPSDRFFRIHNSYLVNLNEIKKFVRVDGGYVIMNNGTQITIARARREEFFAMFDKF